MVLIVVVFVPYLFLNIRREMGRHGSVEGSLGHCKQVDDCCRLFATGGRVARFNGRSFAHNDNRPVNLFISCLGSTWVA